MGSTVNLEPIPRTLGTRQEHTLDWMPVHWDQYVHFSLVTLYPCLGHGVKRFFVVALVKYANVCGKHTHALCVSIP